MVFASGDGRGGEEARRLRGTKGGIASILTTHGSMARIQSNLFEKFEVTGGVLLCCVSFLQGGGQKVEMESR